MSVFPNLGTPEKQGQTCALTKCYSIGLLKVVLKLLTRARYIFMMALVHAADETHVSLHVSLRGGRTKVLRSSTSANMPDRALNRVPRL